MHFRQLASYCSAFLLMLFAGLSYASEVRNTLFKEADAVLSDARAVTADMLAPSSFSKGYKLYSRAEERLEKGRSIEKIKDDLAEAIPHFQQAIESSIIAKLTFESVLKARKDAMDAGAPKQARDLWEEAQKRFWSAAKSLESGSLKRAQGKIPDTLAAYRAAELSAIKTNYLSETRALIEKADKERVKRYAPKTLARAEELLAQAERELTENRYDIDYPRSLAKQAKYEAKHALYIASRVKALESDDISAEQFILTSETPFGEIASTLDIAAEFDEGFDKPTRQIKDSILDLLKDSYELGEKSTALESLEEEMATLEKRLGIQSERLAIQEAQRQKMEQVNDLFSESEAVVMTQGQNVLLRIIGLNFDPGSSTIATRNFNLLNRVQKAIGIFGGYQVVVEGHTDSFGGDDSNLSLSIDRANAVREYLLSNMSNLAPDLVEAFGYGETRPIANNETPEGRTKNRRIDLVLIPANR